jgi:hypothetical protein
MNSTDQVIEFNGSDTLIHAGDDLLCNGCCIDMLRVEAITQSGDASSDLVELHAFLAAICSMFVSIGEG